MKQWLAEAILKKKAEREAEELKKLEKEKAEKDKQKAPVLGGMLGNDKKAGGALGGLLGPKKTRIDELRENVETRQKKRPEEDFKNAKLIHVLQEAYDMWLELETREKEAKKSIKTVIKNKQGLNKKYEVAGKNTEIEKQMENPHLLFKTMMCPQKDRC